MNGSPVSPKANGKIYTFDLGDTQFAVDAAKGGRVVTFSLGGKNVLTGPDVNADNYGSTFWPSPQSDWNWPPPAEIDSQEYTASLDGTTLHLSGPTAASLNLAVSKRISADKKAGRVTIEYALSNHGSQARKVAPWEITRVAPGGLTFFAMGAGGPSKGPQDLLNLTIANRVAWFAYDASKIVNDQKVFADGGEGWIAHVTDDLLLVKAFRDIPSGSAAPGEAEIEIYANSAHTYIEVENQGAYASLAGGATSKWTVRWYLRKLDLSATPAKVGSASLVDLVRATIKG